MNFNTGVYNVRLVFLTFHAASLRSALDAFLIASRESITTAFGWSPCEHVSPLRVSPRIVSLFVVAAAIVVVVGVSAKRVACLDPLT